MTNPAYPYPLRPATPAGGVPLRVTSGFDLRPREMSRADRFGVLKFLLAGYVFLLPVQFSVGFTNFAPSDVFLALGCLVGFTRLRLIQGAWSVFHLLLIFVFLIGAFVAVVDTGTLSTYTIIKTAGLLLLFASYALVTTVATSWSNIRFLLRVLLFTVLLHTAASLIESWAGNPLPWLNYGKERLSGMLLDPNAFGGLIMLTLVIQVVMLASDRPILGGIWGALAVLLLAVGLFLTLSRSAWMALAVGAVVAIAFRPGLLKACAIPAIVAAVMLVKYLDTPAGANVMVAVDRPNTAQQRIDQVNEALPLFSEDPVFGIGAGNFDEKNRRGDLSKPHPYIIHNTTVWIMTEYGLVGLVVFACFIGWFFLKGKDTLRFAGPERPVVVGLMAAHAGMLAISMGIEALYQRHWWLVMALLGAAIHISRRPRLVNAIR